ncbi:hypothetical protein MTO96_049630 [Rhipicephalus appendiculatus]
MLFLRMVFAFEPSVYILEDYIENIKDEEASVKQHLLTATLRLFFARPCQVQDLLGIVFDGTVSRRQSFSFSLSPGATMNLCFTSPDVLKDIITS